MASPGEGLGVIASLEDFAIAANSGEFGVAASPGEELDVVVTTGICSRSIPS